MRKSILLIALAVILLFVGCDQIGIDVQEGSSPGGQGPEDSPMAAPDTSETPGDGQSTGQGTDKGELTETDFTITVEDVSFTIGTDPAEVIDTFGDGGANEDNNFGFIGWDPTNTYKYFRHDYDGFSIVVKTNVVEATSEISQIELTGIATGRGVAPGDTREDMTAQYGQPDEEKSDEGMTDCTYRSGVRTMVFVLNDSGVIGLINID